MEKQTLLNEIKDFAKGIVTKYFPEKEKFSKNAKLADGTLISYDAEQLATGVVAYVVDTTGKEMPMPKGSYVLEDGTVYTPEEIVAKSRETYGKQLCMDCVFEESENENSEEEEKGEN